MERTYKKPACSSLPRKLLLNKDRPKLLSTLPAERKQEDKEKEQDG